MSPALSRSGCPVCHLTYNAGEMPSRNKVIAAFYFPSILELRVAILRGWADRVGDSALLGLGPGQSISWTFAGGETRCLSVLEVYPPSGQGAS